MHSDRCTSSDILTKLYSYDYGSHSLVGVVPDYDVKI